MQWYEDLHHEYLAGPSCFMSAPEAVAELLSPERYAKRWPLIPREELDASCVDLWIGGSEGATKKVLLHRRRVSAACARGEATVAVCEDCHEAFRGKHPRLCKYSLANDMWLGRWDPVFRKANLSHQMLLALARTVTTKVVLRPEGTKKVDQGNTNDWDFLFHQSGIIGSAILFPNATCGEALESFPAPCGVSNTFAVVAPDASEPAVGPADEPRDGLREAGLTRAMRQQTRAAREKVSGIAKLKVNRAEFDEQAALLRALTGFEKPIPLDTLCVYF